MKICTNLTTGYINEPDWIIKINQKINNDINIIQSYSSEFYINSMQIVPKIYENGSCIVTYILSIDFEKFQNVKFNEFYYSLKTPVSFSY